ncbi:hypothetical protein OPKNFCMD_1967 [Methylobacterium crusticola]|uniref:Uncharacterized protein n=1 Tax=Methylobacterium crusticola TaxID=1697972 RepID=A0ABQ4QXD5_9HYPH|nr:hypothetical protein OPKNFCMD_1967 [Methylobacterium crusticola]
MPRSRPVLAALSNYCVGAVVAREKRKEASLVVKLRLNFLLKPRGVEPVLA